jgi:hypothetical protein
MLMLQKKTFLKGRVGEYFFKFQVTSFEHLLHASKIFTLQYTQEYIYIYIYIYTHTHTNINLQNLHV